MSLNGIEQVTLIFVGLSVVLGLIRLLVGPTAGDRIVAADTLAVITTAGMAGLAAWFANPVYLDVALVYGTLAFVGVVALTRAIEGTDR
jgi:multisubunit Na+/H+ antiporter MnhF subunit